MVDSTPPRQWTLRPGTDADRPALTAIYNRIALTPGTEQEIARIDEQRARAGSYIRLTLLDETGVMRGYGLLWQAAWRRAGDMNISIAVDPDFQGQGGGRLLYDAVVAHARELGAATLDVSVRDDKPACRAFAERRGHAEAEHFCSSRLDLAAWDEAAFRPALDRAVAGGCQFITLAEAGVTEENQRRLYELDMDCARDEPGLTDSTEWPPIAFEAYAADVLSGDRFDPSGICIAVKGGEWVGLSGCYYPPGQEEAHVFFTCVRRGHRGQGLAQALKLLSTAHAKAKGCRWIYTGNHEKNPGMLAINRKFGFAPMPGTYVMRRKLAD